jgi:hypothetical protein
MVKFHIISLTLMNSNNRINESSNKTKAIAVIPMTGAIVTAALLLSGLALIGSYQQPVIAQQNMTAAIKQQAIWQQPAIKQQAIWQQPAIKQQAIWQQPAIKQQAVAHKATWLALQVEARPMPLLHRKEEQQQPAGQQLVKVRALVVVLQAAEQQQQPATRVKE